MSNFDIITGATATLASVNSITNDSSAAASAAGYAAFMQSIGGEIPSVIDLGDGRARLPMSTADKAAFTRWLDDSIKPSAAKPVVEYDFSSALTPWVLKYAIPSAVVVFIIGYMVARRRK